jgi:hypothetical protein
VRLIVTGNALWSLLHQEFVRRHDQKAQGKQSIKKWESLPVESSGDKGLAYVEELASTETDGSPIRPLQTNGIMHTDAAYVGFGGTLDVAGTQETLDSGKTKGYGNGRTKQSAFRSGNSRQFVGCSWERWENE